MKRQLSIFFAAVMVAASLCGCGSESQESTVSKGNTESTVSAESKAGTASAVSTGSTASKESTAGHEKLRIVTTIFPEYDWVMNVLGENADAAEVTLLIDKGVDLHSYQPTVDDILRISDCDMFIYVGGESDDWVEDVLEEAANKEMVVVNLLEVLGESVKEEEMVEGMQGHDHDHDHGDGEDHEEDEHDHDADEDHDHDSDADEDHEHDADEDHDGEAHEHEEGEAEYDEHVWLSLRNTEALVQSISDSIRSIDPENAETYGNNTAAYIEKLKELDARYEETVEGASFHTLLFGDRFPFRYLVDDYGLDYYAAFVGCSAETEASFETITFLAQKVDELGLPVVMTIEGSDQKIAETIVQSTQTKDQRILVLDSLQSVTAEDVQNGATYLGVMESNLSVLADALS